MANKSKAKKTEEDLNLGNTENVVIMEEVVKVEAVDKEVKEEVVDNSYPDDTAVGTDDSIMLCSETANVVIKSEGIFVDGELCRNMNKIYNSIMRFSDEHFTKS